MKTKLKVNKNCADAKTKLKVNSRKRYLIYIISLSIPRFHYKFTQCFANVQ